MTSVKNPWRGVAIHSLCGKLTRQAGLSFEEGEGEEREEEGEGEDSLSDVKRACVLDHLSNKQQKNSTANQKYEDEHRIFNREGEFLFFWLNVIASHSASYIEHH